MRKNKNNENIDNERATFVDNFKRISGNHEQNYEDTQPNPQYNAYPNMPDYTQVNQQNEQYIQQTNNFQTENQNYMENNTSYPYENEQYFNVQNDYENNNNQQNYINSFEQNNMFNPNISQVPYNDYEQNRQYEENLVVKDSQETQNLNQNNSENNFYEEQNYPQQLNLQEFQYSNTQSNFINNNLQGEIPEYEASAVYHRKNNIEEKKRNHKYPSMKIRFKAGLIDSLFFLIISIIISVNYLIPAIQKTYSYFEKIGGKTWFDLAWEIKGKILGSLVIIFLINLIFSAVIPFFLKGQTIGKKICKIKIVSNNIEETDVPNFIQLFKREVIGKMLSFLGLGIPFIIFNHDELKRALPDKLANTHIEFA